MIFLADKISDFFAYLVNTYGILGLYLVTFLMISFVLIVSCFIMGVLND